MLCNSLRVSQTLSTHESCAKVIPLDIYKCRLVSTPITTPLPPSALDRCEIMIEVFMQLNSFLYIWGDGSIYVKNWKRKLKRCPESCLLSALRTLGQVAHSLLDFWLLDNLNCSFPPIQTMALTFEELMNRLILWIKKWNRERGKDDIISPMPFTNCPKPATIQFIVIEDQTKAKLIQCKKDRSFLHFGLKLT